MLRVALLHSFAPEGGWRGDPPAHVTDAPFYSASTIMPNGGGGFVPSSLAPRCLTMLEIGCGPVLLVVCFVI